MVEMVKQTRNRADNFHGAGVKFRPGVSGNPAGRPKNSVTALLKNQDSLTTQAICDKLVELAKNGDLPAIREYLDRTDGKVTDTHAILGDITIRVVYGNRDGS
ncbi:hypothetical protein LCGC14_1201710 [marine sediment metagenome]|uniref:DUF5681 domain-containing protein n=1 Tax=marine sediment metagenome TaxID=412755 RepID=A0A0F9NZ25_9ZZZZ